MRDPQVGVAERYTALRDATDRHAQLIREAASGYGFDRHLFALGALASEGVAPRPSLLDCAGALALAHTTLSSSTVPSSRVDCIGFGPVVADGWGVSYQQRVARSAYSITSYEDDATELADALADALGDIEPLLRWGADHNETVS